MASNQKRTSNRQINKVNNYKNQNQNKSSTNGWDVLKAIFNGIFNMFKISKIICLIIVYLLIRDIIILNKMPSNSNYEYFLIDTKILEKLIENDNMLVVFLIFTIVLLTVIIIALIIVINTVYKKEINRLTVERKELLHGMNNGEMEKIKVHRTSCGPTE